MMKILALPKGEMEGNSCQFMLYKEIQKIGHEVDDFRNVNPLKKRYDIIHVHWPELFTEGKSFLHVLKKSLTFLLILIILKIKGTKIIWTCHDVISHRQSNYIFEKRFMKYFIRLTDGIIAPLQTSIDFAKTKYADLIIKPFCVIPTGHYIDIYPNIISRQISRESLNLRKDLFVFGCIGNVAYYKGIPELLHAFTNYKDVNSGLIIAGHLRDSKLRRLIDEYMFKDTRIAFIEGKIPNDELQKYYQASDLIVLPFRKINNSGSLFMALSFNKPVLVPNFVQMREVQLEYANNSILLYEGNIDAEKLKSAKLKVKTRIKDYHSLRSMDYYILAKKTIDFFNKTSKNT